MLARLLRALMRLLTKAKPQPPEPKAPEPEAPEPLAQAADMRLIARRDMARATITPPDVLSRLAEDDDETVRANVASNLKTPPQANLLLLEDRQDAVREELARKIARLLPDAGTQEAVKISDEIAGFLKALAKDTAPRVRAALAEEIRENPHIPKDIAWELALDAEAMVAGPILEYCPLFTDADLLELIAAVRAEGALGAIARRQHLGGDICDAVTANLEIPVLAALLANPSAQIREDTLDRIVEQASSVTSLHAPLVMRTDLSVRAIHKLSNFLTAELLDQLATHSNMDSETRDVLKKGASQRMKCEMTGDVPKDLRAEARDKVSRAHAKNTLDWEFIQAALDTNDRILLEEILCALSGLPLHPIQRILKSRSGKSITALCWKSGMSMRAAIEIQRKGVRLPSSEVLLARGGVDFPLTDEEMLWQLDYFDAA